MLAKQRRCRLALRHPNAATKGGGASSAGEGDFSTGQSTKVAGPIT
jgi:hypothetical protein